MRCKKSVWLPSSWSLRAQALNDFEWLCKRRIYIDIALQLAQQIIDLLGQLQSHPKMVLPHSQIWHAGEVEV